VARGVSDLGVYDRILSRESSRLFLCDKLHAKYFRGDEIFFFGSANLTSSGMGVGPRPNLELLSLPLPIDRSCEMFEIDLLKHSIPATQEIRSSVADAAEKLNRKEPPKINFTGLETSPSSQASSSHQMFLTPDPDSFFEFARDVNFEMPDVTDHRHALDLQFLYSEHPELLPEHPLEAARLLFLKMPLFHRVLEMFERGHFFGAVKNKLRDQSEGKISLDEATGLLQRTMRWAVYLFPDQFEIYQPNVSQQLRRKS
jgi:hypothetical protein